MGFLTRCSLRGTGSLDFFTNSLTQSSNSLVANQQLVSKIYFPHSSFR